MPKKLTLAQVAEMARAADAKAWDCLTPKEQRAMAAALNEGAAETERGRKAAAKFERIVRTIKPPKGKRSS